MCILYRKRRIKLVDVVVPSKHNHLCSNSINDDDDDDAAVFPHAPAACTATNTSRGGSLHTSRKRNNSNTSTPQKWQPQRRPQQGRLPPRVDVTGICNLAGNADYNRRLERHGGTFLQQGPQQQDGILNEFVETFALQRENEDGDWLVLGDKNGRQAVRTALTKVAQYSQTDNRTNRQNQQSMRAASAAVARPYMDDNTDGDDCDENDRDDDDDRDDDKPLAKTLATREEERNTSRLMVYCGSSKGEFHHSKPGNVAYLDAVRSYQGAYDRACRKQDSVQQANIINDIAAQFNFVRRPTIAATAAGGNNEHEWQLARPEWIREKIQKALVGLSKNGRATKLNGNGDSNRDVKSSSSQPLRVVNTPQRNKKPPAKDQGTSTGKEKLIVHCDRAGRDSAGNLAYYQYVASIQGPYRIAAANSQIRMDLVATVLERFDFYQDGSLADDVIVRNRIQNALLDARYAQRYFSGAAVKQKSSRGGSPAKPINFR